MRYLKLFEAFLQPPKFIKSKIVDLVNQLLDKYKEGKEFFDALDSSIKDATNEDLIIYLVRGNENEWLATSGEFGDRLYNIWKSGKFKCKGMVVFNGKILTGDKKVESWYPKNFGLENKQFIYVDDSYFSGKTVSVINDFLKQNGSKIKRVSVIYDGSKTKKKGVNSFFRYYK